MKLIVLSIFHSEIAILCIRPLLHLSFVFTITELLSKIFFLKDLNASFVLWLKVHLIEHLNIIRIDFLDTREGTLPIKECLHCFTKLLLFLVAI